MNFDKLKFKEAAQVYRDLLEYEQKEHWNSNTENKVPQWANDLAQEYKTLTENHIIFSTAWRGVAIAFGKFISSRHRFPKHEGLACPEKSNRKN